MKSLLSAVLLVLMNCVVSAAPSTVSPIAALDRELAAIVNDPERPLASLSVAAMKNGKLVYQRQFGAKWIDNADSRNSKPADANTMYRIASISKLITAIGVMRLVEEGKIGLDRDLSDYLGYRLRNPHFPDDPITMRMLLNHTSSLRDDGGYYWEAKLKVDLKDVLLPEGRLYGKGTMWAKNAKPGAYFRYANLPWGIAGTAMERVTGERFDRLMKRLVLDPMGLKGGFHPADMSKQDLADVATLYRKRTEVDGKEVWNPAGPWIAQVDDYSRDAPVPRALPDYPVGSNGTLFGPQGNCRLSAASLVRVMRLLVGGGVLDGRRILRKSSVEEMLRESWRHDPASNNGNANGENNFGGHAKLMNAWGLGNQHFLDITEAGAGDRLVASGGFVAKGHLGDAWGLTSIMAFDPKTKNGLVYLIGGPGFDPETNRGKYSGLYRHEERIIDALYRGALQPKHRFVEAVSR